METQDLSREISFRTLLPDISVQASKGAVQPYTCPRITDAFLIQFTIPPERLPTSHAPGSPNFGYWSRHRSRGGTLSRKKKQFM